MACCGQFILYVTNVCWASDDSDDDDDDVDDDDVDNDGGSS